MENELSAEAARLGLSLPEYVLRVLSASLTVNNKPKSGAELVEYWQSQGLVGTRPDITDSQAHARQTREQAERRTRT
jgi:hypothetical protein